MVPIPRWNPRRWGFGDDDELIKLIEDDIFSYARKNLALINVYIKVRGCSNAYRRIVVCGYVLN